MLAVFKKRINKIKLPFLFSLILLFSCLISSQDVTANNESIFAKEIFHRACELVNEKFYFEPKFNIKNWEEKLEEKISTIDNAYKQINKLTDKLNDPYTRHLTREEFKDERDIIKSTLVGIGVKLESKKPIILEVLPESPAYESGLIQNDYILAVNIKITKGLNSNQIGKILKGPEGSLLKIKIKRDNEILTKEITRRKFEIKAVTTKMLRDDIALLKIDSFVPENTSTVLKEELIKLMSSKGIILDLRNNSGGLFKNAIDIADAFLSKGKIVTSISKNSSANQFANAASFCDAPLVILVNENTASASEILASALRENNRAKIVGKRTFGKGLIQEVVRLPDDSALHVTVGAYLTPSGKNINKIGIVPDSISYKNEEQLQKAIEIIKEQINTQQPAAKI